MHGNPCCAARGLGHLDDDRDPHVRLHGILQGQFALETEAQKFAFFIFAQTRKSSTFAPRSQSKMGCVPARRPSPACQLGPVTSVRNRSQATKPRCSSLARRSEGSQRLVRGTEKEEVGCCSIVRFCTNSCGRICTTSTKRLEHSHRCGCRDRRRQRKEGTNPRWEVPATRETDPHGYNVDVWIM